MTTERFLEAIALTTERLHDGVTADWLTRVAELANEHPVETIVGLVDLALALASSYEEGDVATAIAWESRMPEPERHRLYLQSPERAGFLLPLLASRAVLKDVTDGL